MYFYSNSKTDEHKKVLPKQNSFSWKRSSEQVECNFDNLADTPSPKFEFFSEWGGKYGIVELFWKKNSLEIVPRDTYSKILTIPAKNFSRSHNFIPESQRLISKNNHLKRKMFCLKAFIWTNEKQLWQPCQRFFTKVSKSFSHQLRKQYTKKI